jgi:hypothetical protein
LELQTKKQSWNSTILNLPRRKNSNSLSADKVAIIVDWDCEGVILVDVMPRGETINSCIYIKKLKELTKCLK